MKVPFFDICTELAPTRAALEHAIAHVLDSGTFIGGPEVTAFERELAMAVGTTHAIGVSSGTDALLATLMALGIAAGDEVVTTPLTFFASAAAAVRLGARVVFADIDERTLTLDPSAAVSACSAKTRAVIPVHLFGCPAELAASPCAIVEDAAQSLGASPLRGIAATCSFFPTKVLGAIGDAGAVVTNDRELCERISLLRAHGASPKYHHVAVGGNFRIDAIQAAILRTKLPALGDAIARRRAAADRYRALFSSARIPPEVRLPEPRTGHVYNQFVIRVPRRTRLRCFLADAGVGTEVYYPEPLHLQPCFAELGYHKGAFPVAERACDEVLALPIQPTIQPDAQAYVVDQVARCFAASH